MKNIGIKAISIFAILLTIISCSNSTDNKNDKSDQSAITRITLDVSLEELVTALAGDAANNPTFQQAIQNATEQHLFEGGDLVTLFGKEFEKIDPNGSLASFFAYEFRNKGIDFNSSNSEVLKVLEKECDDAVDRTCQILRDRLRHLGTASPIIKNLGDGKLLVELPAQESYLNRLSALLQCKGQLEFWETYNFNEVYQDFIEADRVIARKTNYDSEDTIQEHPLFSRLVPNLDHNSVVAASACIGRAIAKDTAAINWMLNIAFQENVFRPDMKFAWTVKPEKYGEEELLELIALKMSKDGKCALGGEAISDARQDYNQINQVEVALEMNREGAKEWKRITGYNIGRQIAIVFDNWVYSYPVVRDEISVGRCSIPGIMTVEEAQDLAAVLKAGKLPVSTRVITVELVDPQQVQ